MITDPKVLAAVRNIIPKSRHGCTTPTCLKHEYNIRNEGSEITSVMRFFNVDDRKADNILLDLKLIYLKHNLDWHGTSKAIKTLQ